MVSHGTCWIVQRQHQQHVAATTPHVSTRGTIAASKMAGCMIPTRRHPGFFMKVTTVGFRRCTVVVTSRPRYSTHRSPTKYFDAMGKVV